MNQSKLLVSSLLTGLLAVSINVHAQQIGRWYDDVGSPAMMNADLSIKKNANGYAMSRVNGDGSRGNFPLKKNGNTYSKINDNFGTKYIVTSSGLEIHDRMGYIRTAKPKR